MPTITVGYKTERDGDLKGLIRILSKKRGSIYVGRSESEIGRMLIRNALELKMANGELKDLIEHLSKKKGSKYEEQSESTIKTMLLTGPLEEEIINEWLKLE